MTTAPDAALRLDGLAPGIAQKWVFALEDLPRQIERIPRVTDGPRPRARDLRFVRGASLPPNRFPALVRLGVCPADVLTYCRVWRDGKDGPARTAEFLATDVEGMTDVWPSMTLRDAIGWVLALPKRDPRDVACQWVAEAAVTPEPGAWLFAAAGMTWAEVHAVAPADMGEVRDSAILLAGLRGAGLPSGTGSTAVTAGPRATATA